MTEQDAPQPKLTALQKADRALAGVDELRGNLAHLTELLANLPATDVKAGGLAGLPLTDELNGLKEKVADLEALVLAGSELGATPIDGGTLAVLDGRLADVEQRLGKAALAEGTASLSGLERVAQDVVDVGAHLATLKQQMGHERRGADIIFDGMRERLAELERLAGTGDGENDADDAYSDGPGRTRAPHVLGLIVALKRQVGAIGKGRRAEHKGGRYDFRGVDDAINAIGNAIDMVGIVPPRATVLDHKVTVTSEASGRIWTTSVVRVRYTFQSPVDGTEWSTEGVGEGRDLADKSLSKASAAAYKYAMFHGLSIAIEGMNVDAETEHPVIDGRPADQSSHAYRQWENQQENQQQREMVRQERAAAAQLDNYTGAGDVPQDVQDKAVAVRRGPQFETAEDAAAYCRQRGDAVGNVAELDKIMAWATTHDLLTVHVDGSPLGVWLNMARMTKPGGTRL